MKIGKRTIILGILLPSLLLLAACSDTTHSPEYPSCFETPQDQNCTCPEGLAKLPGLVDTHSFCVNASCSKSLNGTCVDDCPEGHTEAPAVIWEPRTSYEICFPIRNPSEMVCDVFVYYGPCVCPAGLTKWSEQVGYSCYNLTCEPLGLILSNGTCVDECPSDMVKLGRTTAGTPEPSLCVPPWWPEQRWEDRKCDSDDDCTLSEFHAYECCTCGLKEMNKTASEKYRLWREENCNEPRNYSQFKWLNCPENPGHDVVPISCSTPYNKSTPLECRNGECWVKE